MAQASFAPEKAEFEKVRTANAEPATPSDKRTLVALHISGTAEAIAGSVGGAGVGLLPQQQQLTSLVGQPFANLISQHGVYRVPLQYSVSSSNSASARSTHSALVVASTLQIPSQTPRWCAVGK